MTSQTRQMERGKLGRNSIFVTGGAVLGAFILFPIGIAITRYLGAEGFGDFAFALALLTVFQTFTDGGFQSIIIRDVARDKDHVKDILSFTYSLIWLISIFLFIMLVGYFELFDPHYRLKDIIYIMILTGLIMLHALVFVGAVRAHEAMVVVAIAGIINKLLVFALVLLAIYLDLGLYGIAVAHLLAAILYWLYFVVYVARHYCRVYLKVNIPRWRALIKEALPLGIAITLRKFTIQLDIFLLTYLASSSTVGLYSASYRIVQIFEIGALSLCSVIFPLLSRLSVDSIIKFAKVNESSFRVLVIIIFPVIAWLIILAGDIIHLLYGSGFSSSSKVLAILGYAMLFTIPATLFHSSFAALGKQKEFMIITLLVLAVKAILDVLLIPRYAEIGTAYATVATEFTMIILCLLTLIRSGIRMQVFMIYGKAFICVGFSLLMMLPFLMDGDVWVKLIASVIYFVIYLLMVFITGILLFDDVKTLFVRKQ